MTTEEDRPDLAGLRPVDRALVLATEAMARARGVERLLTDMVQGTPAQALEPGRPRGWASWAAMVEAHRSGTWEVGTKREPGQP